MNRTFWVLLSLSTLALAASAMKLRADYVDLGEPDGDPEQLFKQRSQRHRAWADTQEQVQKILGKYDRATLEALLKEWLKENPDTNLEELKQKTLNDPRFRSMAEALVGEQNVERFRQLSPEQRERLQIQLRDLGQSLGRLPPPQNAHRGREPLAPSPARPPDTPRPEPPTAPPPPGGGPPAPPGPQSKTTNVSDWLARFSDRLKNSNAPALSQSRALQQAIRDLGRYNAGLGDAGRTNSKLQKQLADLGRYVQSRPYLSRERWQGLARLKWSVPMPTLRDLPRPSWHGSGMPAMGLPHVGMPRVPRPREGLGLLWVAVLAILGFVLWKVLGRHGWLAKSADGPVWKLGPWPVQPGAVSSRTDLIQAFEYLSLLRFGPAARSWNHRQIATALAAESAPDANERARAARQLAALYELARYAPGDESFPAEALMAARQDLLFLAGVPTA